MTETLLGLGATSAQADVNGITVFHRYAKANAETLLDAVMKADPAGIKSAINHMAFTGYHDVGETPLQAAAKQGYQSLVSKLLDVGAMSHISFETW